LRCPGCIAPEKRSPAGGHVIPIAAIADHVCSLDNIEGITLSGGEPFMQADALNQLVRQIHERRALSVMAYTGYTLSHLREHGSASQRALLRAVDILVDGPYVKSRATAKIWRGSDNQSVHFLTPRYAHLDQQMEDECARIQVLLGADGSMMWVGIPPPGFRDAFEKRLSLVETAQLTPNLKGHPK